MSPENLYTRNPNTIVFYSKSWCPDCHRARSVLVENQVQFLDVDVAKDNRAREFVKQINNGNESVPTIVFPDGTTLVEPRGATLAEKLKSL